jgi:hypothetical protein
MTKTLSNPLRHLSTAIAAMVSLGFALQAFGQINPQEVSNPLLKQTEQTYFKTLIALKQTIDRDKFPYPFHLSRFVGLEVKDQIGSDERGLEFVDFHGRTVLKVSGNYNVAFSSTLTTPNQRADEVLKEVISPLLKEVTRSFTPQDSFNDVGFEIAYHVRTREHDFDYEGKEFLVVLMEKEDAFSFLNSSSEGARQEILSRSEVYLNGKPFGLALGQDKPFETAEKAKATDRTVSPSLLRLSVNALTGSKESEEPPQAFARGRASNPKFLEPGAEPTPPPLTIVSQTDADNLQKQYQSQLDTLGKEGVSKMHFVDYAPPSFVVIKNQIYLQLTLRNPARFDAAASSIYRRAAQTFDLFLAPQLKPILDRISPEMNIGGLDITVVNELTPNSSTFSEAIEFVCPVRALRALSRADLTTQDLINQSSVIVNGVRIALNLQQVE